MNIYGVVFRVVDTYMDFLFKNYMYKINLQESRVLSQAVPSSSGNQGAWSTLQEANIP